MDNIKDIVWIEILETLLKEKQRLYIDTYFNIENLKPILKEAKKDLDTDKDNKSMQVNVEHIIQQEKANKKALPVHLDNINKIKEMIRA